MSITVYNSLTRKKEPFLPASPPSVTMYVCGPTVYDLSHIGHARSAVCFDVIYRYLKYRGFNVTYARNYTDVDDKIIKRAAERGVAAMELAEEFIREFDRDMEALGVATPDIRPRATETVDKIIEIVRILVERGFAYELDGDVYFEVRKFPDYGKLSGKNIDELEAGARVDVDKRKKDPLDFALWKKSKPGEPSWQSPWGPGRPGWHIECSAMCLKFLGETIDIHGGGKDLIFPHHENEIAQSEAATGRAPFVKYWLHNGFVNIEKVKMSKSLGNILNIRDALKRATRDAVRLFILSSHYHSPIDYSEKSLREAEAAAERFYRAIERVRLERPEIAEIEPARGKVETLLGPVLDAMDDDFNTALAFGNIFNYVAELNRLLDAMKSRGPDEKTEKEAAAILALFREAAIFLGTLDRDPDEYFGERRERAGIDVDEVERLIKERAEARKRKDFKRADEIRETLLKTGVVLEDTPQGTIWTVK